MKLADRILRRHRPDSDEPVDEEAKKLEEQQKALEAQKQLQDSMRSGPYV